MSTKRIILFCQLGLNETTVSNCFVFIVRLRTEMLKAVSVHNLKSFVPYRGFHFTLEKCVSFKKQGKVLSKLMYGSEKNKRKWFGERNSKTVFASPSSLATIKGQGKESNRRLTVLNKLFMQHITDLMATGEYAEELFGYGIQISRVQINTDFHGVKVFWFGKDSDKDMEIGHLLKRVAGGLRHELSQLRLIGQVPKLTFVKDKTYGFIAEIDSALRQADFGDDYEFTKRTPIERNELKLQTELPTELREEIGKLDNEAHCLRDDQDPLPDMRHDVLGLNHALIINKIKRSLSKSKQAWSQYNNEDRKTDHTRMLQPGSNEGEKDSDAMFSSLLKRQRFKRINSSREKSEQEFECLPFIEEQPNIIQKDDDFILDDNEHKSKK